jgi:hypothetical protein
MAYTSADSGLLQKCNFDSAYSSPYRDRLIALAKGLYRRLKRPSGAIPNLSIFELHLETALVGAIVFNEIVQTLSASGTKGLPKDNDPWWDGLAGPIARFLVWKDWPDISS